MILYNAKIGKERQVEPHDLGIRNERADPSNSTEGDYTHGNHLLTTQKM